MMRMHGLRRTLAVVTAAVVMASVVPALAVPAQATPTKATVENSRSQEVPARQAKLSLPMETGDQGRFVRILQERLQWLGYQISTREWAEGRVGSSTTAAVRAAQDKFFLPETGKVDAKTWRMVKDMAGDVGVLPRVCRSEAKALCIDKTAKVLRYVRDGKVDRTVHVRFGVAGKDTHTGTFRVYFRWRNATSGINGPNVPRVPMPYALFYDGDFAVHHSPTFARSGYYPGGGSNGCVNIADVKDSIYIFDQMQLGGLVHIYWG